MGKVLLLGVMLCCIHDVSAVMHSWKAFNTASTGLSEFPEYVAVNILDDEDIGYFDSRTSLFQYRQKWMEENLGQDYVKQETDILKGNMQRDKASVRIVMERFNQSGGVHVYQRMYGLKDWQTEDYTCVVEHKSLEEDIVKRVIEREIRRNQDIETRGPSMGVIIGCVVGVLLLLALAVVGVVVWKKRGAGYGKTNTSDTESENSELKPAVKA
ncbi:hypothetical protein AAFF_G00250210 [Aldrovandia affinis]|uniref:MHC class I-like antigen recognition-like domain-containing protein n=1 Tax=Aldrovandia affinis TaxID=143900 RepID=A0AAD7W349_9TELE|nr:hypothetical protein AAFF_G00250210 [Aldrovandia affinis]